MEKIIIKREQLYPQPGRVGRFAWKWLYYYVIEGETICHGDHLGALKGFLRRRYPGRNIIMDWK